MASKKYVLDNFKIGESVVPLIKTELTFVVTDIDKEHGLIICRIRDMSEVIYKFKPDELEKEIVLRPPNIVDFEISEDE